VKVSDSLSSGEIFSRDIKSQSYIEKAKELSRREENATPESSLEKPKVEQIEEKQKLTVYRGEEQQADHGHGSSQEKPKRNKRKHQRIKR